MQLINVRPQRRSAAEVDCLGVLDLYPSGPVLKVNKYLVIQKGKNYAKCCTAYPCNNA